MANGSTFRFAGVVQQPEHRRAPPEAGGKNPPPRSNVYPFPRRAPDTGPLLVVIVTALAGCALCLIGLAGHAGWIVFRGLPW